MIRVLGPLEVDGPAGPVDVGSPRHREVLAALIVDVGRVVSTDALHERVWGDGARGATTANLHAIISRLRGRLKASDGLEIVTVPPGYRLDVPAESIDAVRFVALLGRARSSRTAGDLELARQQVEEALALWRGDAYAEVQQPFAQTEAARLAGQRLAGHELAADLDLALGRHDRVLTDLAPLVAEHPLREPLRVRQMLALYRAGNQADALAVYADVRAVLVEELGLDPGPELQRLYQRILEQDDTLLDDPRPAASPAATRPADQRTDQRTDLGADLRRDIVPPAGDLVGRADQVAYVRSLLDDSAQRIVTLTGVGGVGKTRLAHAVATAAASAYRDGVAMISLAPLTDPATVVPEVGRATGLTATDGLDPVATVAEHLRNRELLVVLDNHEHLLEAAGQVSRLVASCPGLTLLVTSRAPLRVRGEIQYQVTPLPLPAPDAADPEDIESSAAVALFVERAEAASPGFELDASNAAAVGAICRRLAGIPLALELAAARVRLLPPVAMLPRLDEMMATSSARDLPPRQRTMRTAIDWSHDLLRPEEQQLFRRLSVFAGGFSLDAAEAVADQADALSLLDSLVEHSLVVPDGATGDTPRFRMLEPILQYAADRLVGDEALAVRANHRSYFRALAAATEPRYRGEGTIEALALTQREHPNYVAALESGLADGDAESTGRLAWDLWLFWWLRGHLVEGRRITTAVLERDVPDDVRVRALAARGAMTFAQGDLEEARCWVEGAALAAATDDPVGQSHCVAGVGLVALAEGDLEAAERAMDATIPLCERTGDRGGWLWTLAHVWQATIALLRGDPERAEALVTLGLDAGRRRHDPLAVYIALFTAAQVAIATGDTGRARRQLEEGIALSLETGDLANLAYFLDALAVVESQAGRHRRVGVLHGASGRLRESVGANVYGYYKPDEALLAEALAVAATALGETEFAAAVDEGRRLTVTEVAAYARGLQANGR